MSSARQASIPHGRFGSSPSSSSSIATGLRTLRELHRSEGASRLMRGSRVKPTERQGQQRAQSSEAVTGMAQRDVSTVWCGANLLMTGVRCSPIRGIVGTQSCATRDFRDGDARESTLGDDWEPGYLKGQCGQGRYIKGIAHKGERTVSILCCSPRLF